MTGQAQLALPFTGEDRRLLDRKGRLALPARHRARLGNPFILTRASNGVLIALPDATWLKILRTQEDDAAFLGFYVSGAELAEWEPTCGRVMLPYGLREYADLPVCAEAVVAGVGAGLIIAEPTRWAAQLCKWETELARRAQGGAGVAR
jgi:MraZ protein